MKPWKVFPLSHARFNGSCLDPIRTGLGNWEKRNRQGWGNAIEGRGDSFVAFQRAKGTRS